MTTIEKNFCPSHQTIEASLKAHSDKLDRIVEGVSQLHISVEALKRVHDRIDKVDTNVDEMWVKIDNFRDRLDEKANELRKEREKIMAPICDDLKGVRDVQNVWSGIAKAALWVSSLSMTWQLFDFTIKHASK
jgi:uncharacterized coiled-coil DUF342 family protein